jgi:acyl dehydratase
MATLELGAPLPEIRLRITGELVEAFAAIANDHSRLHFDDAFARERGFPAAIAHGAIAASTFTRLLDGFVGDGQEAGATLKIAFLGPAFRGDEVVASGRVASVEEGTAVLELWCAVGERKLAVAEASVSTNRRGNLWNSKRLS